MFAPISRTTALAIATLLPLDAAAQEDAYLSCPEEVACFTAQGCRQNSAGALFFTIYNGGRRVVVEGLGPEPLVLRSTDRNVYEVEVDEGVWFIVLAEDWSRYYMVQAFPQMGDSGAITGPCERRPY
jgi:hypothetical protein